MSKPLNEIYMHQSSGLKYYPFAPNPAHVDPNVIAHHLATRARWNGATQHRDYPDRIFYSVAEHSIYVAVYLEGVLRRPDLALQGLLHDASEAYNGDLIRPLKYSTEFAEPFKKVEVINEEAVSKRFSLPLELDPLVKVADDAVCNTEMQQIVPRDPSEVWPEERKDVAKTEFYINMFPPHQAKKLWLDHFYRLTAHRKDAA